jgi:hypothetical protein
MYCDILDTLNSTSFKKKGLFFGRAFCIYKPPIDGNLQLKKLV